MRFAVSGFGRSGTMWLAQALNKDPKWIVEHEPDGDVNPQALVDRFSQHDQYGEVNSMLLPSLLHLPVDTRALLLRHPARIFISCCKRGHEPSITLCQHLGMSLAMIDTYIDTGVEFEKLENLIADRNCLNTFANKLGVCIKDEEIDSRGKINASTGRCPSVPDGIRNHFRTSCMWFIRKYYQ